MCKVKKDLKYRRQFLISKDVLSNLSSWKILKIGDLYLYSHPDLEVCHISNKKWKIVLIGYIFDSKKTYSNIEIIQDILENNRQIEDFISNIKQYAGSYIFIFISDKKAIIIPDARATREIYYCSNDNKIISGSQPHLIARFAVPEILETSDSEKLDFYKNTMLDSLCFGNETRYKEIKHLLPNHYLDIKKRNIKRFWPIKPIVKSDLAEVVPQCSKYLQGIMKSIITRYPSMMAITSGADSRILLATSKDFIAKIYLFINNYDLNSHHPDITIPQDIFNNINIPFHIHEIPNTVDPEFREYYFNNTFLASENYLPSIYNAFYKKNKEKICILGMGEIGRNYFGKKERNLNAYRIAYKYGYEGNRYIIKQCNIILHELEYLSQKFKINALDLIYWEHRLGNWGATRNSESLIAIEKFDPFNSYFLNEFFLGLDEKYKINTKSTCMVFNKMIDYMWPELLNYPINPAYSNREKLSLFLKKIGLFNILKEIKYQYKYLQYKFNAEK